MRKLAFMLLACLLSAGLCPAAGGNEPALSLQDAVREALRDNRELRAARYAVDQAKGRLAQAGRWPSPELEVSGMSDGAFGGKGEAAFSAGLYQTFPLTSRLALSRHIGRLDVERAVLEIRNHERLLAERVRIQFIRAAAGQAKAALWKRIEAQQAEIAQAVARRLEAGQGSAAEAALAATTQAAAWKNLSEAETAAALDLIGLKTLLGLPAEHPLRLTGSLQEITTQLRRLTGDRPKVLRRPDAELALLEAARADLEIRLARAEAWEGIRIGVEYSQDRAEDAPEGLGTDRFLGVKVSIPLPVWAGGRGAVAEKTAQRAAAQARIEALQLEMANSLAAALREVSLLSRRAGEIRSRGAEPLERYEEEMRKGFEEGRVELRDWLAVRSQLAEMEAAEVEAQAALAEAYAKLAAATGAGE